MNNTPQDWRDIFIKEWVRDDGLLNIGKYDQEEIMSFIETKIAQAEERGEERMRLKTIEFIDNIEFRSWHQEEECGFEFCQEKIKNFLSCL